MRLFRLGGFLLFLALCPVAFAASRAVIVVGLAPGELASRRLQETAAMVQNGFVARGLSESDIVLLGAGGAPAKREAILRALASAGATTDETWVVLLGTSAIGRDGQPAFQVSGPRLTANDLCQAVSALPGHKYLVIATSQSGGFLPPLAELPEVDAVAATTANGEMNEPRFGEVWATALQGTPAADFSTLANETAHRVQALYAEQKLAQLEHATRWDAPTRQLVRLTPAQDSAAPSPATTSDPAPNHSPTNIEIPTTPADDGIVRLAATDESRQLIATARANASSFDAAAVILHSEDRIVLEAAGNARHEHRAQIFVRTGESVDQVASLRLPHDPPRQLARLLRARIVQPDGAQILVNPTANPAGQDDDPRVAAATQGLVELPEVVTGSLVEIDYSVELRADDQFGGFYHEWSLAVPYPTVVREFRCTLPGDDKWRWLAPNLPPPVESRTSSGARELRWTLHAIAPAEGQLGDPPPRTWLPWVAISSIASWDDFAAWYRRIASDAMTAGPRTTELAKTLASQHPDRLSLIRAAYERVAALRYVAIELGVGGFRPRLPDQVLGRRFGDCKDKANLLVALLRTAGIDADFALVNRGEVTFTELPGFQFNHALVRVPAAPAQGQPHDLWLDATDRLVPFGSVPQGDLGRAALIVGQSGQPSFATITAALEAPCLWQEEWQIGAPAAEGQRSAHLTITGQGAAEETLRQLFCGLSPAGKVARLQALIAGTHPALTVESVSTTDAFDLSVAFSVQAELTLAGTARPAPCPPYWENLFASARRTRPLLIWEGREWTYRQTVRTAGTPIAPTENQTTVAGLTLFRQQNGAVWHTEFRLKSGAISPTDYAAIRAAWLHLLTQPSTTP